jgi:hypothetical protein
MFENILESSHIKRLIMRIEYQDLMQVISNALIKDKRNELIGGMLIAGKLDASKPLDQIDVDGQLSMRVSQTSLAVIKSLVEVFKGELEIVEDGQLVEFEEKRVSKND